MPFWDRVADFALLKNVNHSIAPAIDGLAYDYRSIALPRFPLKRFLIASTAMVELIFLVNFVALFARKVRKHALFVWTCFDRTKIFQYFGASGLIFFGLWYVLFFQLGNIGAFEFFWPRSRPIVSLFGHSNADHGSHIRPYGGDCWTGSMANRIAKTKIGSQDVRTD